MATPPHKEGVRTEHETVTLRDQQRVDVDVKTETLEKDGEFRAPKRCTSKDTKRIQQDTETG